MEKAKFEKREKEPIAVVKMDMARHSIKGKLDGREVIAQAGMEAASASRPELREDAAAVAEKGESVSVVGSPRERTLQSGAYRALGEQMKDINIDNMDPHDIVRWLEEGKAIETTETPLLDFQVGEGEYKEKIYGAFGEGRLLTWMLKEADQIALETGQDSENTTTGTIQAGNVAALIYSLGKYRADKAIEEGKIEEDINFATSHQSVLESFLYHVIKEKEGDETADKLLEDLNNTGFAENKGFTVRYEQLGDGAFDWEVKIDYEGKEYEMSAEEMVKIMQAGVDLKAQMAENSKLEQVA